MGRRVFGHGWAAALALFLALFVAAPAAAAAGLPVATCTLAARPGMTATALLRRPGLFDCTTPQPGSAPGDYWVLSRPLPDTGWRGLSVRTADLWQQRVTLYVLYADGAIRRTGFTSTTTAPRLVLGPLVDLPLPEHPAAPPRRLLWHIEGSGGTRGIVVGARLTGHGQRYGDDLVTSVLYAALGAGVLSLLIYNLALWGALRQRFQPAYCLMLACLLVFGACSSGLVEQLTGIDDTLRLRLTGLGLALTASSVVLFARRFFEREVFAGWLERMSGVVIAALLAPALLFAFAAPWRIDRLDHLVAFSFIGMVMLVPAVLYRAWHTRSEQLWPFALAWGAPISLAGARVAAGFGLSACQSLIDHATVPSLTLEALLSALAMAARIRLIIRERDEAREQEVAARLLADTDPLTGLLNRRAFLDRAIGSGEQHLLVLVDIDHFKLVNDALGHDGGDEVLRVVARTLRAAAPPDALVARLGGEEFAILAPADAGTLPPAVLERLRAARMPFDLAVTASIGTCVGPLGDETDWKGLYRCADRALFDAKTAGRDRVRSAALPLAIAA